MLRLTIACVAAAMMTVPTYAAAPCKDAKTGKFVKCPPKPAAAAGVTKDKNGKCHFAAGPNKGKFTKCP